MRQQIKKLKDKKYRFSAKIKDFNFDENGNQFILLVEIRLFPKNKLITDHIWVINNDKDINEFKNFIDEYIGILDEKITFSAYKKGYKKGYRGKPINQKSLKINKEIKKDFTLTNYSKIRFFDERKGVENLKKQYLFFLSGFMSNWYKCNFKDEEGNTFNCTEQYIMYKKALLFNDNTIAKNIIKCSNPKLQKQYGRQVRGFVQEIWDENIEKIAYEAIYNKFSQNNRLKKLLINTYPNILVEANPYDRIWGIGYSEKEAEKVRKKDWGENLLGKTLMKVREDLMK